MHHYLDPGTLCGLVGMAVTSKLYEPKTQQMPFCTSVFLFLSFPLASGFQKLQIKSDLL